MQQHLQNKKGLVKSVFDQQQKVSAASRKTDFSLFFKKDFDGGIFNANISRQGNIFQAYGYDPNFVLNETFTEEYWGYSTLRLSFIDDNIDKNKLSYSAKLFAYDLPTEYYLLEFLAVFVYH